MGWEKVLGERDHEMQSGAPPEKCISNDTKFS